MELSGKTSKVLGHVLAFAFLCIGALILNDVYLYHASKSWPSITGTVTSSYSSCGPSRNYNCTAEVSYAYGARTGQAQVQSSGLWSTGKWTTDEMLNDFREGAAVKVRVDPARPGRTRLEGAGAMDWRVGLFLLALAAGGFALNKDWGGGPGSGQGDASQYPHSVPPAATEEELAPKPYRKASSRYGRLIFALLGIAAAFLINLFLALRR